MYYSAFTVLGALYTSKVYVAFSYGDRIMKAKAKQVGDEFAQALNKRLSGEEAATPKVNVGIWQVLDTYFNRGEKDN